MLEFNALRIFVPATIAFLIGIAMTPVVTHFLYAHKMWKPRAGKAAMDGTQAKRFNELHATREVGTPRLGGIVVWGSALLTAAILSLGAMAAPNHLIAALGFVSRSQTWVPLGALAAGAVVGAIDDLFEIWGRGGLRLRVRIGIVATIALVCALWFYYKLGVSAVSLPFIAAPVPFGALFVPFFVLVALFIYAGGVIDGIDGLAGGEFAAIFAAYTVVAIFEHEYDLAALCAAIVGGLLAFLWFNIPPARFYLSETGTMGLTLALTVIAFLTDAFAGGKGVAVLPVIALPLVATVLSDIGQIISKRLFGRKLLHIAPLHHHFEALGWPPYKVTMRYWIVSIIAAIVGLSIAIL